MGSEWKKYTIADVSKKVVTGKTPPGTLEKYFGGNVLFVTPTDMADDKYIDSTQRTLSSEGEEKLINQKFECGVVVSCIGWQMGKAAIIKKPAVTNQQINTIIPNNKLIDVDFLYYTLFEKRTEIFNLGATATRTPILKKSLFEKIEFHAPSLEQQKKISGVLSALDSRINCNKKINQTLEQMAQALFKSWFVDFEPVKAKITALEAGGTLEDATLAAMTAISGKDTTALAVFAREQPEKYGELRATAELFPAAMQGSELGEIPQGWNVSSISDVGSVVCGKTPSKKVAEFYGENIPFIKIPDMHNQLFIIKTNEYLSESGSHSQNKKLVPAYSICVSCIATVGVVAITTMPSHTNQQINSIIPINKFSLYYLYFCMRGLNDYLHALGSAGSATLNVNTSTFSSIKVLMPNASMLELYHEKCECLFNKIKELSFQNDSLAQLRDTLLPKLLSGEITLPEAQQAINEVEHV